MADIIFLLIIFFMVSTVFDVSRGIQMRLPATATQQDIKERNVTISIDTTQALYPRRREGRAARAGQGRPRQARRDAGGRSS